MGTASIRGRLAGETHAAAISRIVALTPHTNAIVEALARVTASPAFHSSRRAQEFLRYVVEHALAGELDQLKERCIGAALFDRPPDYDTGSDSVVRVAANEVRKRLAAYYRQTTDAQPVSFELPAGCYIPDIRLDKPRPRTVVLQVPKLPVNRWRAIAIAGWGLALAIAMLWLVSARNQNRTAQSKALGVLPWVALFEGGQSPRLVVADSSMGALRVFRTFPGSVEDYANHAYLSPPDQLPPQLRAPWSQLAVKRYTSLADARIAADYAPLAVAAGHIPAVVGARDLHLSDFHHGESFILLGSNSANPWVELFQDQMEFVLRFDGGPATRVEIRHPQPGDPKGLASDVVSGTAGEAYATLSLLNGLGGRGRVLIAQGTNMEGTDLAGELAMNPDRMVAELRACGLDPGNPVGRFEILLRLTVTAGSARSSSVLARRCHIQPAG